MKTASKKVSRSSKKVHLAVIASRFNDVVCEGLIRGAKEILDESSQTTYDVHRVPGAFELPLVAQRCARSGKYGAIICLGAVIRGETPHFDYVCKIVSEGVLRVMLDYGIPIGFGILTTDNEQQAKARLNVGASATEAALRAAKVIKEMA